MRDFSCCEAVGQHLNAGDVLDSFVIGQIGEGEMFEAPVLVNDPTRTRSTFGVRMVPSQLDRAA
jgi:hypothetical protein